MQFVPWISSVSQRNVVAEDVGSTLDAQHVFTEFSKIKQFSLIFFKYSKENQKKSFYFEKNNENVLSVNFTFKEDVFIRMLKVVQQVATPQRRTPFVYRVIAPRTTNAPRRLPPVRLVHQEFTTLAFRDTE